MFLKQCFNRLLILLLLCGPGAAAQLSRISREQALQDIHFFDSMLLVVHPRPFLHIDSGRYHAAAQGLSDDIGDSISIASFLQLLYRQSAFLRDAHTTPHIMQPVLRHELSQPLFFPYALVSNREILYVPKQMALQTGIPAGSQLTHINGRSTGPMLYHFGYYCGASTDYRYQWRDKLLSYLFYLQGIRPPFELDYIRPSGKKGKQLISKAVNFGTALAESLPQIRMPYRFEIAGKGLAVLSLHTMDMEWQPFSAFLDSCFLEIKSRKINRLAIDLRQNSGGNSLLADLLFSYITDKSYRLSSGRDWKVSQAYKDYLLRNGDSNNNYHNQANGTTWSWHNCTAEANKFVNENKYTGQCYLITGPFTFSSANMMADAAKTYQLATLIGEPSGEYTNDFGETYSFQLPNSNINMQVSTAYDFGADCREQQHTVVPDFLIQQSLKEKINAEDKALQHLLQLP